MSNITHTSTFQVSAGSSVRDGLAVIENNRSGVAIVVDAGERVVGVLTDGDVRRWLMNGGTTESAVESCMNSDFISVTTDVRREQILKLLDHRIKFLPAIARDGRLANVYTRDHLPVFEESRVFARARAPVRISFGGGGTDLTRHFIQDGGVVINATISVFSHATLRKRADESIRIFSNDFRKLIEAKDLHDLNAGERGLDLIRSIVRAVQPEYGFDLYVGSEFPIGSGLGGSSAVTAAVLGCFNEFRRDRWDNYEIAEIAFQAERLYMDVAGGWQDQYATVFGGFNYMEFSENQNIVHPLRLRADISRELEESLVLCDTRIAHNSGEIHKEQRRTLSSSDADSMVQKNKELTHEIKNHLLRGRLTDFGLALHKSWMLKRSLSASVSSNSIDDIYELAAKNGSVGGKLLGAGGGGHFLFFAEPFRKFELMNALKEYGLEPRQFTFDHEGLQTWSMRDHSMPEAAE